MIYKLSDVTAGIGMVGRNVIKTMDGQKTQTRRVESCLRNVSDIVTDTEKGVCEDGVIYFDMTGNDRDGSHWWEQVTPRYQPGKVYYVKEALQRFDVDEYPMAEYKSDGEVVEINDGSARGWERDDGTPWKPSVIPAIYMPKSAARTFIKIIDVKCERLHDIRVADIKAEGVSLPERVPSSDPPPLNVGAENNDQLRQIWRDLWNESNGKKCPWESNPRVFAYEYKTVEVGR